MPDDFGRKLAMVELQLEANLAPIHRQLVHLHSLQLTRVMIGPAGVEVETVWTPEAARMRDKLEELCRWLTSQHFLTLWFLVGEVPPEDPRRSGTNS